jgi:hypothetical protein
VTLVLVDASAGEADVITAETMVTPVTKVRENLMTSPSKCAQRAQLPTAYTHATLRGNGLN